jgi:hypothetical protein
MKINLRALGAALIAVFVFGAVAASAASAEGTDVGTDHFTSEKEKTVLTGEQVGDETDNLFGIKVVPGLKVTCKKATYTGTMAAVGVTTITAVPTYKECIGLGGAAATVTNDRCAFILTGTTDKHGPLTPGDSGEKTHATVHLECSHEKNAEGKIGSIRIKTGGCEFIFQSTHPEGTTVNQELLGVTYTNEGAGATRDIKVDATVDKIHYTTNDAFACTIVGIPTTGTDGFLTTTVTVKGFEDLGGTTTFGDEIADGNHVGIFTLTDVGTDHFTSEKEKTVLTGEQVGDETDNLFGIKVVPGLKVTCKKATYTGTTASVGVTTITAVPTYKECIGLGAAAATVTNDRCAFVLTGTTDKHGPLTPGDSGEETHATVHLECDHNKVGGKIGSIRIVTGGCEFIFQSTHPEGTPVNQNLLGVTYTNEGSGATRDIKIDGTIDGIHYTTNDAFACTIAGIPPTGNDGFMTTTMTVKGFEDLGGTATFGDEIADGKQVGIFWS